MRSSQKSCATFDQNDQTLGSRSLPRETAKLFGRLAQYVVGPVTGHIITYSQPLPFWLKVKFVVPRTTFFSPPPPLGSPGLPTEERGVGRHAPYMIKIPYHVQRTIQTMDLHTVFWNRGVPEMIPGQQLIVGQAFGDLCHSRRSNEDRGA